MSRYGLNKYDASTSTYGPDPSFYISLPYFTAVSSGYGAVSLSWGSPTIEYSRLVLVRNLLGYPSDPDDGVTLHDIGNAGPNKFIDDSVPQGAWAYYAVFAYELDTETWYRAGAVSGLSVKDFNSLKIMWEALPYPMKSATRGVLSDSDINKDLYAFISLVAFEVDRMKTQAYLIHGALDPKTAPEALLKPLVQQLGLEYEGSVGMQRMRSLAQNSTELRQKKGSLDGLKLFIKALSGYDVSIVPGKNLFLDYNASSFEESPTTLTIDGNSVPVPGLWSFTGSSIIAESVAAGPGTMPAVMSNSPTGYENLQAGVLEVAHSGDFTMVCGSVPAEMIPVTAGAKYAFSIYAKDASNTSSAVVKINWYNLNGSLLSSSTSASQDYSTTTRVYVVGVAPTGAAFAQPELDITSVGNRNQYYDAAQFEAIAVDATAPTDTFEDARRVNIHLFPTRVNEITNPNFTANASGWTGGTEVVDGTLRTEALSTSNVTVSVDVENSETVESIVVGETYTFSIYAGLTAAPDGYSSAVATVVWKDSDGDPLATDEGLVADMTVTMARPSVTSTAPDGAVKATLEIVWTPSEAGEVLILDKALFEKALEVNEFFDGSYGLEDASSLWWEGGLANNARSFMYRNHFVVTERLKALLPEYLPSGASFALYFY